MLHEKIPTPKIKEKQNARNVLLLEFVILSILSFIFFLLSSRRKPGSYYINKDPGFRRDDN